MTYNEILPLAEVKNYLRIDDDFLEDDLAIERMVRSALQFIEKRTNHIFEEKTDVEYLGSPTQYNGFIDVYDFPFTYSGEAIRLDYSNKVRFKADSVVLDSVGYQNREAIPDALIEAALQMIKVFYFEGEKQSNTTLIPENVHQILGAYRRFTV